MCSKTDARYGGEGAPPTKPKVEGYRKSYWYQIYKNTAATIPSRVTFIGLTEYLKGRIYNVGTGSQANQFTVTTKAL